MEKYLFLDLYGVMIPSASSVITKETQGMLALILKKTNAKIIITSSFRLPTVEETKTELKSKGFLFFNHVVGVTIRPYHFIQKGIHLSIPRGVEIKQWLDTHIIYPWIACPEKDKEYKILDENGEFKTMKSQELGIDYNYVIIDDESDMLLEHKDHFVQTDHEFGLTLKDALKAIEILNGYDVTI